MQALFTHGTAIPLPRESVPLLRSRQDSSPRRPSPRRQPAVPARRLTPPAPGADYRSVTTIYLSSRSAQHHRLPTRRPSTIRPARCILLLCHRKKLSTPNSTCIHWPPIKHDTSVKNRHGGTARHYRLFKRQLADFAYFYYQFSSRSLHTALLLPCHGSLFLLSSSQEHSKRAPLA